MTLISDVQADVAVRLHAQLQRRNPGSPGYEIAEKALSLVFNAGREASHAPFLHRNVLRDAKRILRRARSRRPEALVDEPDVLVDPHGSSPEDVARVKRLADFLRDVAREVHPLGAECFEGLLAGETLSETSKRAGLLETEVKRVRAVIRSAAREVLVDAA